MPYYYIIIVARVVPTQSWYSSIDVSILYSALYYT